jgi:hypothetical protein
MALAPSSQARLVSWTGCHFDNQPVCGTALTMKENGYALYGPDPDPVEFERMFQDKVQYTNGKVLIFEGGTLYLGSMTSTPSESGRVNKISKKVKAGTYSDNGFTLNDGREFIFFDGQEVERKELMNSQVPDKDKLLEASRQYTRPSLKDSRGKLIFSEQFTVGDEAHKLFGPNQLRKYISYHFWFQFTEAEKKEKFPGWDTEASE